MQDKFLESIRLGFISQVDEIINDASVTAKKDKLNAIDTLILVNNNISTWISSINGMINIDENLLTKMAELKKTFVTAAKQEVAKEVAQIIENEQSDVTKKINDYMINLKKKGLDLDGNNKEDNSTTNLRESNDEEDAILASSFRAAREEAKAYRQSLVFNDEPGTAITKKRNNTIDCPPDSCGGGGGCGGGC